MPPRGRPKKGNKRIDAAIDALAQFGFQQSTVCKTINELLKVYGGDDGWPFVEEASYKLVIETILEKQTEGDKETKAVPQVLDECIAHAEEDDTESDPRVRDVYMVHPEEAVVEAIDAVPAHIYQPPSSPPQRPRRPPCYGYISESEEEGDGPNEEAVENVSGPSHQGLEEAVENASGPSHQGLGRRKSRWDEKPAGI